MFNIEQWLIDQESVDVFEFENATAAVMPLLPNQQALAINYDNRDDFIENVSNFGLCVNGERFSETGSGDTLAKLWKLKKLPEGFREALAEHVAVLSGIDMPEAESEVIELTEADLAQDLQSQPN